MTVLKRILQEKRTLLTIVAVILAIDVGLYGFGVYPWSNKVSQSETRAAAANGQLGQARATYAAASETSANKDSADSELQRFYTDVLPVGPGRGQEYQFAIPGQTCRGCESGAGAADQCVRKR